MAGGRASRWGGKCKHMMPVCGVPVLKRTVWLCGEFRPDIPVKVITWRPECMLGDKIIPNPSGEAGLSQTLGILETAGEWSPDGMTHLILGDVSFQKGTLREILTYTGPARAWGRMWGNELTGKQDREIFAYSFPPGYHGFLKRCCEMAVASHLPEEGDMWDIFNFQCGGTGVLGRMTEKLYKMLPNESRLKYLYPFLLWWSGGLWYEVDEFVTDDFDYPEDYDKYVAKITPFMLEMDVV